MAFTWLCVQAGISKQASNQRRGMQMLVFVSFESIDFLFVQFDGCSRSVFAVAVQFITQMS